MTQELVLYIVRGTTGEYEDRREWTVCWRATEQEAEQIVEVLNKEAQDYQAWLKDNGYGEYEGIGEPLKEEDPKLYERWDQLSDGKFSMDYTGTEYYVVEVGESLKRQS